MGIKKKFWVFVGGAVIIIALVLIFFTSHHLPPIISMPTVASMPTSTVVASASSTAAVPCLATDGDEIENYAATNNKTSSNVGTVTIINKISNTQVSNFTISDIMSRHYHDYELHNCAIYVIREFNYDYVKGDVLPNYNTQLWRYSYTGTGLELGSAEDFRVNPQETFVAVVPFSSVFPGLSLQIYDLKTNTSSFSLSLSQIPAQDSSTIVNFDLENGGWSSDGRYVWFDSSEEADSIGFVRIDTANWSYQAFPAPSTTMGGDAFNPDTGMTTYRTNAAPWTGDATIDQQYRNQAAQSGQITSFYIYDFLTNKNYLVATTTNPTYYYQPKWLSDTMLQYTLPSGATTTYTVPQ